VLALTSNAVSAIQQITAAPEVPHGAGLRIATGQAEAERFTLSVVTGPDLDDQVVEDQGARLFLDPAAAAALDDKTMDAQVDGTGVQFLLT
jgi:iron-sulfur cluster assembly protein